MPCFLRSKLFQRRSKVREQKLSICVHGRAIVNNYKQSDAQKTNFQVSTSCKRSFPPIVAVDRLDRTGTYLQSLSPSLRTDFKRVEVFTLLNSAQC